MMNLPLTDTYHEANVSRDLLVNRLGTIKMCAGRYWLHSRRGRPRPPPSSTIRWGTVSSKRRCSRASFYKAREFESHLT